MMLKYFSILIVHRQYTPKILFSSSGEWTLFAGIRTREETDWDLNQHSWSTELEDFQCMNHLWSHKAFKAHLESAKGDIAKQQVKWKATTDRKTSHSSYGAALETQLTNPKTGTHIVLQVELVCWWELSISSPSFSSADLHSGLKSFQTNGMEEP